VPKPSGPLAISGEEIEQMVSSENTYLTRDGLWRELDALGEDRVRQRLAQGAYTDRTRLLVEEWLRQHAEKRALVVQDAYKDAYKDAYQDAYRVAPSAGPLEPIRIDRIERREDNKMTIVAATAAAIAAFMATIAATASVLAFVQPA
jgi:hypothetical protein